MHAFKDWYFRKPEKNTHLLTGGSACHRGSKIRVDCTAYEDAVKYYFYLCSHQLTKWTKYDGSCVLSFGTPRANKKAVMNSGSETSPGSKNQPRKNLKKLKKAAQGSRYITMYFPAPFGQSGYHVCVLKHLER